VVFFEKKIAPAPTQPMVRVYPMVERLTRADLLLAENLRTLIAARRVDAGDVALACGHGAAWISKILNGDRGMRVQDVGKAAAYFGLTVSEIFSPGISAMTERRRRTRRAHLDRRVILDRRLAKHQADDKLLAQPSHTGVELARPAMKGGILTNGDGDYAPATSALTPEGSLTDIDRRITAQIHELRHLHELRQQALALLARDGADGGTGRVRDSGRTAPHVPRRRPKSSR
jgi:hypothetical protein